MHEILFRGKRVDNGEWVYGNYCEVEKLNHAGTEHFIIEYSCDGTQYYIDPETVGQYTGLTDKNGIKIFEGDIILYYGKNYILKFIDGFAAFDLRSVDNMSTPPPITSNTIRHMSVAGNIFDNPNFKSCGLNGGVSHDNTRSD